MIRYGAAFAGPSAIEERADALDHSLELRLADPWKDRQRQRLACESLCGRELAPTVTEPGICTGEVDGLGIVAAGSDGALAEEVCEPVGIARSDDVEMPHRVARVGYRGLCEVAHAREPQGI